MKRVQGSAAIVFLFTISIYTICQAVPVKINYQGMLEDAQGAVNNASLAMTFRLFGQQNEGTPLWEEGQSVNVDSGIYHVILGDGTMNPSYSSLEAAVLGNDSLWLEVQINDEVSPMSPRQPVNSVVFAIRAGTVSDGAITSAKLAGGTVTTDKLPAGVITTDKIADGAVTAAKIVGGDGSGLDADLLDGQTSKNFASATEMQQSKADIEALETEISNLGSDNIATGAITTSKLANSSVTSEKIASGAVTSEHIALLGVEASNLNTDAVTTLKVKDYNITTNKLALAAVTASRIAGNAVDTENIVDHTITADDVSGPLYNSRAHLYMVENPVLISSDTKVVISASCNNVTDIPIASACNPSLNYAFRVMGKNNAGWLDSDVPASVECSLYNVASFAATGKAQIICLSPTE